MRFELGNRVAIVTCSGVLRLDDARDAAATLWDASGWLGESAVWDFRKAELDFSPSEVRALAQYVLHHQPAPAPKRIAFVMQRDVDFGLARMFAVFRESPETEFDVFREYDEAIRWARSLGPGVA